MALEPSVKKNLSKIPKQYENWKKIKIYHAWLIESYFINEVSKKNWKLNVSSHIIAKSQQAVFKVLKISKLFTKLKVCVLLIITHVSDAINVVKR